MQAAMGNPQAAGMRLMQSNSEFASFVNRNLGKSPQQILSEWMSSNPNVDVRQRASQMGIDYDAMMRSINR